MTGQAPDARCDDRWRLLNDLADGEIEQADRIDLERHLERCETCRAAFADLQQLRQAARTLPPRRPRADAWERIAREIERQMPQPQAAPSRPLRGLRAPWPVVRVALPLAAVLVLAVASAVWLTRSPAPAQLTGGTTPGTTAVQASPVHPSTEDLVRTVDEELRAAEAHYDKAISSLELIARSNQDVLDPTVAATLQRNLQVIDGAIRESREAIQTQPSSQLAQDSLFEALRRKVTLLEDTIALINAMRKGDQEGTARAIQGMSKT